MQTKHLRFSNNTASIEDILTHFRGCNPVFYAYLCKKVDLISYSKKIQLHANKFEIWDGTELVGLVAAYFNDNENKQGFITNVSVLDSYSRQGIASALMQKCIDYASLNTFLTITLEVNSNSHKAIGLYNLYNFETVATKDDQNVMQLNL